MAELGMKGLVLKTTGSWSTVLAENKREYPCKLKGKIRLTGSKITNPVAVGDHVLFLVESDGKTGSILKVLKRKNYIIRRSSNLSREGHVIAANIDRAILMVTVTQPVTHREFIDRYLATAEAYRIPATLLFNKLDLYSEAEMETYREYLDIYEGLYHCLSISVKESTGIDSVRELLANRVSLISGNSGVGKSSLINAIEPSLKLKTASISHYHLKGKHTTTFSEMFNLSNGGFIIDTPGIKGFGLIDMEREEIFHFFPEIFDVSKACQFHNCLHLHEPGCAVIQAVEQGTISAWRYRSYLSILNDTDSKYR